MSPRAVIFDMDGLLLDTERVCFDAFLITRRDLGLPEAPEVFLSVVGLSGPEGDRRLRNSLPNHIPLPDFQAAWDTNIHTALQHAVPVKPGALRLMQILSAKGMPMAVATSTLTATARHHLEHAGLLPHLKGVIGFDQVTLCKPDPEVYHTAADLLGLAASDCIAFEDSEPGTTAALASGATTVQIPDLIQPSEALVKRGHLIAASLLDGATKIGLITPSEAAA